MGIIPFNDNRMIDYSWRDDRENSSKGIITITNSEQIKEFDEIYDITNEYPNEEAFAAWRSDKTRMTLFINNKELYLYIVMKYT